MRTQTNKVGATARSRLQPAIVTFALCLLPFLYPNVAQAQGFVVRHAHTDLVNEVYRLDAEIDYELSEPVLDALESGVPITIEIEIEVFRMRPYMWDDEVARLRQRYRLQYHALSRQYMVTNLNSRVRQNYPSLAAAIEALGTITDFPMLDQRLLKVGERYLARLRSGLDIEALPAPLRLLAYLSSDWRVTSDWYVWEL